MACLFCSEYAKELLTPEQVNRLRIELIISSDDKHLDYFESIRHNLSSDYKNKLEEYENEHDSFDDPFDTFPYDF